MSEIEKAKIDFEDAITELEKIVRELEQGNLKLKEALEVFQRGIELSTICAEHLDSAEKKIDLLVKGNDGKISIKSAEIMEEDND